jgi:hypothetical protein
LNDNKMASGVVATVAVTVASSVPDTSSAIQVLNPTASDATGHALGVTATGGTINISQSVKIAKLVCSPSKIYSHGSSACTVKLSGAAPSGGTAISFGLAKSAPLTVSASVTVPAGSATTQFSAQAGVIGTKETAAVTATLSGKTASYSLNLAVGTP